MKITNRKIDSITPYAGNPRQISEVAVRKVAASLDAFGWQQPIVVDQSGVIIAGHTRHLAAQLRGHTEVPVHVADTLTPDQVAAYRLADNRTGEETTWDDGALRVELARLADDALVATGFDRPHIDRLVAKARASVTDMLTADEGQNKDPALTVTEEGDVWQLGRHKLRCGDCTAAADVSAFIDGISIDCIVTDPPYCSGGWQEAGRASGSIGTRRKGDNGKDYGQYSKAQ